MDNVYPLIKSHEWLVNAREQSILCEPVLTLDNDEQSHLITYVMDQDSSVTYVPEDAGADDQFVQIKNNAFRSLRKRLAPITWQDITLEQQDFSFRYLAFIGDFYAAECVLLKERLQEAHADLNSKTLLACTPQRGMLLVFPLDHATALTLKTFYDVCLENFTHAENEPISAQLWQIEDGVITSQISDIETLVATTQSSVTEHAANDASFSGESKHKKLYLLSHIFFITLFGTVLAGLYALASNYRAMGQHIAYKITIAASIFIVPIYTVIFISLPRSSYDRLFPLGVAVIFCAIAAILQKRHINNAINLGLKRAKIRHQVIVIALSLLCMLPLLSVFVFFWK